MSDIYDIDYYKIGQRIRKFRKAYGISQEQLAEQIGISTTHLSHIETGNTKLSLPVFVKIAQILSVHTDELLFDTCTINKSSVKEEIINILDSCSTKNAFIIYEIIKHSKIALEKYDES